MSDNKQDQKKMGFASTLSMAAGGMIGGGIFSALGVVILVAGQWAWLSFVFAGLIALATSFSYVELSAKFGEGGGAFTFLREINHKGFAGSLSWVLIIGYILTMSVYAFTFGHYASYAFGFGLWGTRLAAILIVVALIALNLRGVGETAKIEIFIVWGNIIILLGLAAIGLWHWQPAQLSEGISSKGISGAVIGSASIFMAYEGFQLLTYDYEEVENPKSTLIKAVPLAAIFVIFVYVLVTLGATMISGAQTIVDQKEVALSVAAKEALGMTGLVLLTIAATFATGAAINSTLFATARLAKRVADDDELPKVAAHQNKSGIPDRAVITLGIASSILAVVGSLSTLVEAASLAFLFTFAAVNFIAYRQLESRRWISACGALGAVIALFVLVIRLLTNDPIALLALLILVAASVFVRPFVLKHTKTIE